MQKDLKDKIMRIANHYKYENQREQAIEEMAELIVALNKFRRYGTIQRQNRLNAITTELADVWIMVMQLSYLLQVENEVEKEIEYKVNRTINKIENSEV